MVPPEVNTSPPAKLRSAPEVPTLPWATTVVPALLVQSRQYPAVPAAAVALVIAFAVSTPPLGAAANGFEHGSVPSNVPDAAVPQLAGADPV